MGGSAAAADLVATAFADALDIPFLVVRGYRLPGWCGPRDLVACVSYSGSTEETIAGYSEGAKRGCRLVVVASGGELVERASADDRPVVRIPGAAPSPRAGVGELVGGLIGVLHGAGVLPPVAIEEARRHVDDLAAALAPEVPTERNESKSVAAWLGDRVPVIWGSEGISSIAAFRWKAAFNENAEIPAFASSLPELDHHEVVGWAGEGPDRFALVVLRELGEHDRVGPRVEATLEEAGGLESRTVRASGGNPLGRGLELALVGDLASAYHAIGRGLDPAAMDPLTRVKQRLAGAG